MPKINPELSAAIEAQKAAQAARLTSLGLDPNKPPRDVSPIRKNISLEPFHTWRKASGLPLPQTPEANDEMWARYRYETGKTPPVGFGKNPVEMRGWTYDPNSSTNIYKQPPMTPTPISDDIKNWYKENMPDYYKDQFDPGYNPPNRGYGNAPTGNQPQPSTYTPASIYNTGVPTVGANPTDVPFNYGNTPAGPQPSNATDNFTPVPQLGTMPTTTDQFQSPQMGTAGGGGYRGATPYKRGRRSTLPTVLP